FERRLILGVTCRGEETLDGLGPAFLPGGLEPLPGVLVHTALVNGDERWGFRSHGSWAGKARSRRACTRLRSRRTVRSEQPRRAAAWRLVHCWSLRSTRWRSSSSKEAISCSNWSWNSAASAGDGCGSTTSKSPGTPPEEMEVRDTSRSRLRFWRR